MSDALPNEELISAYLDGEVSSEEQALVERAIECDEETRKLYDDLRELRVQLESFYAQEEAVDFTDQILDRTQRLGIAPAEVESIPDRDDRPVTLFSEPKRAALATLAVSAIVLMMFTFWRQANDVGEPLDVAVAHDESDSEATPPSVVLSESHQAANTVIDQDTPAKFTQEASKAPPQPAKESQSAGKRFSGSLKTEKGMEGISKGVDNTAEQPKKAAAARTTQLDKAEFKRNPLDKGGARSLKMKSAAPATATADGKPGISAGRKQTQGNEDRFQKRAGKEEALKSYMNRRLSASRGGAPNPAASPSSPNPTPASPKSMAPGAAQGNAPIGGQLGGARGLGGGGLAGGGVGGGAFGGGGMGGGGGFAPPNAGGGRPGTRGGRGGGRQQAAGGFGGAGFGGEAGGESAGLSGGGFGGQPGRFPGNAAPRGREARRTAQDAPTLAAPMDSEQQMKLAMNLFRLQTKQVAQDKLDELLDDPRLFAVLEFPNPLLQKESSSGLAGVTGIETARAIRKQAGRPVFVVEGTAEQLKTLLASVEKEQRLKLATNAVNSAAYPLTSIEKQDQSASLFYRSRQVRPDPIERQDAKLRALSIVQQQANQPAPALAPETKRFSRSTTKSLVEVEGENRTKSAKAASKPKAAAKSSAAVKSKLDTGNSIKADRNTKDKAQADRQSDAQADLKKTRRRTAATPPTQNGRSIPRGAVPNNMRREIADHTFQTQNFVQPGDSAPIILILVK